MEKKHREFGEEIDLYLNQTRLRDRVMKEMIKKLEKKEIHGTDKPKKNKSN